MNDDNNIDNPATLMEAGCVMGTLCAVIFTFFVIGTVLGSVFG